MRDKLIHGYFGVDYDIVVGCGKEENAGAQAAD